MLYAYCLMCNHYHLLLETPEAGLCKGMQRLNGRYTQRFNYRHSWCGHLFQGRYKAIIVEKEAHLLELCRYVVLNPVRADIVELARDWPWSSYAATMEGRPGPDWLACNALLRLFSEHAGAAMAGISPGRVSQIQSQMMRGGAPERAASLFKKYKVKT